MFGKEKSTWEELSGIFTAQEIYQQPATWAKTIAQIKNEKEALKKFMEPVLSDQIVISYLQVLERVNM